MKIETFIISDNKKKRQKIRWNKNDNSDTLFIVLPGIKTILSKRHRENYQDWYETDFPEWVSNKENEIANTKEKLWEFLYKEIFIKKEEVENE